MSLCPASTTSALRPTPPPPHSIRHCSSVPFWQFGIYRLLLHHHHHHHHQYPDCQFFLFWLKKTHFQHKIREKRYFKNAHNIVNNYRTVKSRLVSVWNEILVKQTSVLARPFVFWSLGAAILGARFLVLNNGRVDTRDIKLTVKRCFPLKWFSSRSLGPIKRRYVVQF